MTTNTPSTNWMPRWAVLAMASLPLVAAPFLAGCSSSFWDRSPAQARVQGIFVRGPLWDVNDPSQLNGPVAPAVAADWNRNPVLTGDPDGESAASARAVPGLSTREGPVPSSHDLSALTEVNRARAQYGLAPVRYEARLFAAAFAHSHEQMRDGFLGHDSRDPSRATLGQRVTLEGYVGRTYAEVVAKDFPDAKSVVAAWLDSPRHREVLLDPDLAEAAFARVDGPSNRTNRWTGDFADPGRSSNPIPAAAKPEPAAMVPPVPSPATRVSLPPAPPRGAGLNSQAGLNSPASLNQPARPPVPSPIRSSEPQPSGFPPSAPPPSVPPTNTAAQPRVVTQAAPARSDGVAPGNVVPPAPGKVYGPARPYVPPAVAPRTTAPVPMASAPRPTYVAPVPPPAPSTVRPYVAPAPEPYRPPPQPRRAAKPRCKT